MNYRLSFFEVEWLDGTLVLVWSDVCHTQMLPGQFTNNAEIDSKGEYKKVIILTLSFRKYYIHERNCSQGGLPASRTVGDRCKCIGLRAFSSSNAQ